MNEEVEELFGEGTGHPQPRTRLAIALLVGGLVLTLLGLVCTAAPGGLLVLGAWAVIEKELDRVESGYLPVDVRPRLQRLQRFTVAALVGVVVLFVVQSVLLCAGFYDQLWGTALQAVYELLGVGAAETPVPPT